MYFFAPINGPKYEISNNVVCASTKGLEQLAHMRSLIRAFASGLKLLTDYHLKFLSFKGGRTGSSEPIRARIPHCPCADPEGG